MPIPKQKLPSLEEAYNGTLFGSTDVLRPDEKKVVLVDPSELVEIEDQPFHLYSSEKLAELAEDIKENGQINPCTVRLLDGKKYILAGRNRKKACELAGVKVACIFIECDNFTANLILVNSNLNQRHELLPSEKAFAYKLQKESYEAKGKRKSTAAVAEQNSENVKLIQRYIKLTDLNESLLNMIDGQRLPVSVGFEISYFNSVNMGVLSSYLVNFPDQTVSVQQAQDLRDWNNKKDFDSTWLNDFFHNRIKKETKELIKKCPRSEGLCSNYEVMKKHFLKNGNWEGCSGCCCYCIDLSNCEYACNYCRPAAPSPKTNLISPNQTDKRDKALSIQFDTPEEAERALVTCTSAQRYTEMEASEKGEFISDVPQEYDSPSVHRYPVDEVQIAEVPESGSPTPIFHRFDEQKPELKEIKQTKEIPNAASFKEPTTATRESVSVTISVDELSKIPCPFKLNEADPDDIREWIINSLMQYFCDKSK